MDSGYIGLTSSIRVTFTGHSSAVPGAGGRPLGKVARARYRPAMATSRDTAESIVAFLEPVADIRIRAMMGGWLVYSDDVLVGQVNEGELFLKPTPAIADLAAVLERRPPYPGAKPAWVVDRAHLVDAEWMRTVLSLATQSLRAGR